jgi:hypothetical protein
VSDEAVHARARSTLTLAGAALLFGVLATANAGGYRYAVSDQAFYGPAIALSANPSLFPRDRALLEPQMRLWTGDSLLGWLATPDGSTLPALFAALHAVSLVVLFASAVALARGFGLSSWAAGAFVALLTLRHQITRTGANTLEGYGHPRMLAFAIGLAAFAGLMARRRGLALLAAAAAAVVHTTTGLWFLAAVAIAVLWELPRRSAIVVASAVAAGTTLLILMSGLSARFVAMDDAWVAALGDRSYLFSGDWPLYAWLVNLSYPVAVLLLFRHRRSAGAARPGEAGLLAGLLGLVAIFLVSVPLTELRLAIAVQLQVNRVFWLLDAVTALYVAWWIVDVAGRRWPSWSPAAIAALLVVVSAARGYYVLRIETDRPLVQMHLPDTGWAAAMAWLRTQPTTWHVLADPQHGWRFGSSVRLAALRDTLFEAGKDPAVALYDRGIATRVAERAGALAAFDAFTTNDIRALGARYGLDVFVAAAEPAFDLPALYRNDGFIVYDLR